MYLCHKITFYCDSLDFGKITGQKTSYMTMKKYPDIKFRFNYLLRGKKLLNVLNHGQIRFFHIL